MIRKSVALSAVLAVGGTLALSACTENVEPSDASGGAITVDSSASACDVSAAEAPSGNLVFNVTNSGNEVTEFYLLGEDGLRIFGEVENVGPGLSRDLVVQAGPGSYFTACKPGMVGDGIRAPFVVTDSGVDVSPTGPIGEQLDDATAAYGAYVRDQTAQLVVTTDAFARDYVRGNFVDARAQYATARMPWERIEPVAESFGDLDPRLDLREADLEPGQEWTGWHAIEKDLWPPTGYTQFSEKERRRLAALLIADTAELNERVQELEFTPDQLGNGAKELLDEVATGKVTGEEEFWSHTDLWDFQANLDGARIAYEELRGVVKQKNPELAKTLDKQFTEVQGMLNQYRDGDGYDFVFYDELTPKQVQELADGVDALGEPLSQLTATVVL